MEDAHNRLRPNTVWMDVTTSWRSRGGAMNGTLRVEQSYAAALADIMPKTLRLCRYHTTRRRFIPVATLPRPTRSGEVARGRDEPVGADSGRAPHIGRKIERAVRIWRRSAAENAFRWIDDLRGGQIPFVGGRAGDILLLTGENWSRYDFSVLRAVRQRCRMRIAAICQDLIPVKYPQFFEADGFAERFARYVDFLVNDVDLVIAISDQTKKDILHYASGRLSGTVHTIRLGHDVGARASADESMTVGDIKAGQFVLSVSTIQSRKNFDLLYHLWRRMCDENVVNLPKLVIVGRRGFGSKDLLWQIAHDPAVRDCIIVNHAVSDTDLAWLYRHCMFTLYPSFYEGFGLPVSESLAYGKFCIASNAPALEEAGQGLAKHIDPLDFVAWRDTILELVHAPGKVVEAERRIKERYRPVTWHQSAQRLAELLRPLCEARS